MVLLSDTDASFELDTEALDSLTLDQVAAFLGLPADDSPSPTLDTTTPLDLIEIFSPGFGQTFDDTMALLDTATGTLELSSGILSGSVTTAEGTQTVALDGTEFLDTLLTEAGTLTANGTLENGLFSGSLGLSDGSRFATSFDAASLLESAIFTFLDQTDVVIPFANGQFALDIPTALGPVTGGIDFAGGDLNVDLETPLGALDLDYDFLENSVIGFDVASPVGDLAGSINLADSQVIVPLMVGNISLGAVSLALENLSGQVALQNGVASLSVDVPDFGLLGLPDTVTTELDLGPLASELVESFTESTGALAIDSGIVTAAITSPIGSLDTTFSLVDLTAEAVNFLTATTGTLTLDGGNLTAGLETPVGNVDAVTTLNDIRDFFTLPLA